MFFKSYLFLLLIIILSYAKFEPISETVFSRQIKKLDIHSGFGLKYGAVNDPFFNTSYLNEYGFSLKSFSTILEYYSFLKGIYAETELAYYLNESVSYLQFLNLDIGILLRVSERGIFKKAFPYTSFGIGRRNTTRNSNYSNNRYYRPTILYRLKGGMELFIIKNRASLATGFFFYPTDKQTYDSKKNLWISSLGVEIALFLYPFSKN